MTEETFKIVGYEKLIYPEENIKELMNSTHTKSRYGILLSMIIKCGCAVVGIYEESRDYELPQLAIRFVTNKDVRHITQSMLTNKCLDRVYLGEDESPLQEWYDSLMGHVSLSLFEITDDSVDSCCDMVKLEKFLITDYSFRHFNSDEKQFCITLIYNPESLGKDIISSDMSEEQRKLYDNSLLVFMYQAFDIYFKY